MFKKANNIFILFFTVLTFFSCRDENRPLFDAISNIEKQLSKNDLDEFVKKEESKAIGDIHFGYGMTLRNEIRSDKDSVLLKYFNSKGIFHLDDMSSIIFKTLHRKHNSKKIDLEKQIQEKIKFWKPYIDCEKDNAKRFEINDSYSKGDSVQIRLKINDKDNIAYPIECLNLYPDWVFDDNKDLLIRGIVLDKYYYDYIEDNKFMKIKIISINKINIPTPRDIPKIGDEFQIVLNYEIIEKW